MLHDPEEYPEPEQFKPERFIGENGQINPEILDPRVIAFGFGRRYVLSSNLYPFLPFNTLQDMSRKTFCFQYTVDVCGEYATRVRNLSRCRRVREACDLDERYRERVDGVRAVNPSNRQQI